MSNLKTPVGMGMFVHLFVPKPVVVGGEPRYSLMLLIDQDGQKTPQWAALRSACAKAIDDKFGAGKSRDKAFVSRLRSPFRDATEKAKYEGFTAGKMFITPWTKNKPGVVDGNRNDILAPADVWSGQLMRASVRPFAYQQGGNAGVNFMLENVQIVDPTRPRMDGRMNAKGDFDRVGPDGMPLADDAPDVDPDDDGDEAPF